MDSTEFRRVGKDLIDYIADYLDNIQERNVYPDVEPGYLKKLQPETSPEHGQNLEDIIKEFDTEVMPGIAHWQHPNFNAYYSAATSYPAIIGEMLAAMVNTVGFTWISSPASTEVEMIVMDWLGKAIGLPEEFLFVGCSKENTKRGGGVMQSTATEAMTVALLAAKRQKLVELKETNPGVSDGVLVDKLICYSSAQSTFLEKSALIAGIKFKPLALDEKESVTGNILLDQIQEDRRCGLEPCYMLCTLGTTPSCAFDKLDELGPVCQSEKLWLHVDAAYAGSAFICPEFQYLMKGVQMVDSFSFNPHKNLLVSFGCSPMWVKDRDAIIQSFEVNPPLTMQHKEEAETVDYRNWGIPLGRNFRALKLWFVLKSFGIQRLQEHIRNGVRMAKVLEKLINEDDRFEVVFDVILGLVCFKLKNSDNELNKKLHHDINETRKLHMSLGTFSNGTVFLRFSVQPHATEEIIRCSWNIISDCTSKLSSI